MVEGRTHRPVVHPEKCQACSVCVRECPAEIIPEYRNEKESLRSAIYRGRVDTKEKDRTVLSPCQEACPIKQDARGYVALIGKGKFKEAMELIREVNPLPAVCGYICHHPCEEACLREGIDAPVPIRLLKRFVMEYGKDGSRIEPRKKRRRREKVLVIGSGPAGLAAANDLSLQGFGVTVLETLPVLGGMLRVGIPEFRLPRDTLQKEIEGIKALGVEMIPGRRFAFDGNNKTLAKLGFQAAFLAIGAHRSIPLKIPGEKLQGVVPGAGFLRDLNLGKRSGIGKKIVVIGGGNAAVDVARSAVRLGAEKVRMACIESREEMPAIPGEVEKSIQEGVRIHALASPIRILGKRGKVIGLEMVKLSSSRINEKGKIETFPLKNSNFTLEADEIITAIGQRVDQRSLDGLDTNRDGTIRVNPETGETSMKGVFAGGDAVTGPGWAIDAIAAGKRGAKAIAEYLS